MRGWNPLGLWRCWRSVVFVSILDRFYNSGTARVVVGSMGVMGNVFLNCMVGGRFRWGRGGGVVGCGVFSVVEREEEFGGVGFEGECDEECGGDEIAEGYCWKVFCI